jgi:hypothetical protein
MVSRPNLRCNLCSGAVLFEREDGIKLLHATLSSLLDNTNQKPNNMNLHRRENLVSRMYDYLGMPTLDESYLSWDFHIAFINGS